MQRQGRKLTHALSHTIPTGPRACGGELTVAEGKLESMPEPARQACTYVQQSPDLTNLVYVLVCCINPFAHRVQGSVAAEPSACLQLYRLLVLESVSTAWLPTPCLPSVEYRPYQLFVEG